MNYSSLKGKVISVNSIPYSVEFNTPFKSSEGSIEKREGAFIKLSGLGLKGYGEASPLPGYSIDSLNLVSQILSTLENKNFLVEELLDLAQELPSLEFGISSALGDLLGKLESKPLRFLISEKPSNSIQISQLGKQTASRTQVVKLKVSPSNGKEIEEIVTKNQGKKTFRIDANRSFEFKESLDFFSKTSSSNIQYVEEPFSKPCLESVEEFFQKTGISIALDESIYKKDCNIEKLAKSEAISAFVIKPCFIGSLEKIVRLSKVAEDSGKKVIFSSPFDYFFGMASNLQIAAALSNGEPAGFDTFRYFKAPSDLPNMMWEEEAIQCNDMPGLGIEEQADFIYQHYQKMV